VAPRPHGTSGKDPSTGRSRFPTTRAFVGSPDGVAASDRMEKVETASASLLLDEAEKECRSYRFTEATRPFLAEIFLRRWGYFVFWKEGVRRRGPLFPCRAMRPGFTTGPRPVSPAGVVRMGSDQARPLPEAELLVRVAPLRRGIFGTTEAQE